MKNQASQSLDPSQNSLGDDNGTMSKLNQRYTNQVFESDSSYDENIMDGSV